MKTIQETTYYRLPDTSRYMVAVNGIYSVQTIPVGGNTTFFKPRGFAVFKTAVTSKPNILAMFTNKHKLAFKKVYKKKDAAIAMMQKIVAEDPKAINSLIDLHNFD